MEKYVKFGMVGRQIKYRSKNPLFNYQIVLDCIDMLDSTSLLILLHLKCNFLNQDRHSLCPDSVLYFVTLWIIEFQKFK